MKQRAHSLAAALAALAISLSPLSCSSGGGDPPGPGPGPSGPDVYVAGTTGISTERPALWKNGAPQQLASVDNYRMGEAQSVFVSGSDVYVAGYDFTPGTSTMYAVLWKNGVRQELDGGQRASSVFVSGNDVYVAGSAGGRATLWKNGVAESLHNGTDATSVFVSGGDVYVAGFQFVPLEHQHVMVWKNGVAEKIGEFRAANTTYASRGKYSIFVSGGDVYVTGEYCDGHIFGEACHAIVWKNGVAQQLSDADSSIGTSVFVSGGDVYVAGYEGGRAVLWKNGARQQLGGNDNRATGAYSVYVLGNDVYVAGIDLAPNNPYRDWYSVVWKNGAIIQRLGGGEGGYAYSVFVK